MSLKQVRLFTIVSDNGLCREVYGASLPTPAGRTGDGTVRERLVTTRQEEVLAMDDGTFVVSGLPGTWRQLEPSGG